MSRRPYALLAELTYRCPLRCPYCSNPTRYPDGTELTPDEWGRVLREAAGLGVLHVGFSGGEPLLRNDLPEIIVAASEAGLYTNLITSGIGLDAARARSLQSRGLRSVQLSFQSDEAALADEIAGVKAHERKLEAVRCIQDADLAFSMNVVLHRANMHRLEHIIALAERLGAERLELASAQYYGWALLNRPHLLPTREQVVQARRAAEAAKLRLSGRMEVLYILPDYYETRPKPCMAGWGMRFITVNSSGDVLPCPTAFSIPGMQFENVRTRSLAAIWHTSGSFNRFRGTDWMPEPCRSCDQRETDFGGCRCQAALLTGDPAATDPVCRLSPHRSIIDRVINDIAPGNSDVSSGNKWVLRTNPLRKTENVTD
jgi:PqqA peptide cyclase